MKKVKHLIKFSLLSIFFVSLLFSCGIDSSVNPNFPTKLAEMKGDPSYKSPNHVEIADAQNQATTEQNWWQSSAFYHIWIKAFNDSNNDGIGDIKGIEQKLDYIKDDLGCDAIWISPFWECLYTGDNMHGYDVVDFYKVNPKFGTEQDVIDLINACHTKNIKIIFDFIPNHTAGTNEWFLDSIQNKNNKGDWYIWNESPLKWNTGMSLTGWDYVKARNQYYYHAFANTQPDLNYRNYEVREEMKNVVRYWLNKGFDGLRIDAVRYLIENSSSVTDTKDSHTWFSELRKIIDQYENPKFMVCEAWIEGDRQTLNSYFGTEQNPEFNMVFDFDQAKQTLNNMESNFFNVIYPNPSTKKSYGTFIGNHDEYLPRPGSLFGGYTACINFFTSSSLLKPTVPFIYYGNELGMKDAPYNGDYRLRTKIDWAEVEKQKTYASSTLNLNKALLNLRKSFPNLFTNGTLTSLSYINDPFDKDFIPTGYVISDGIDKLVCLFFPINYNDTDISFELSSILSSNPDDYKLIMGNTLYDENKVSIKGNKITFEKMIPYETRVYYIGSKTQEVIFNEDRMFLRGTMNDWGYEELRFNISKNSWETNYEIEKNGTYEFKFDKDANWTQSYDGEVSTLPTTINLSEEVSTSTEIANEEETNNFAIELQKGTYLFSFNKTTEKITVTRK